MDQRATYCSSLKIDADDEIFSLKNYTLYVNFANTDYLSSYTARNRRQKPSGIFTRKIIHDANQPYSKIPRPQRRFSEKQTC